MRPTVSEHRVATRVGELVVRVEGEGPIAVLWHSLYIDDQSWDRVRAAFAARRRLVRITGPGHGLSAPTRAPYTLEDCAEAALEVLTALELPERLDWVGSAWGGHVGIVLAAAHPERVRSLVTLSAPVRALAPAEAKRVKQLILALRVIGAAGPVLTGVTNTLLSPRTRQLDPSLVDYIHHCLQRARRPALINAIRSISLRRPDLGPLLPAITAPTAFIVSPDNALWTPEEAREAAATMPDAEVVVLEATGHLPALEAPDETAEIVRALWARAERGSAPAPGSAP